MIEKTKKDRETRNTPKNYLNSNTKYHILKTNAKGITLIALIITIIVMLILVGVTISVAINGGLFKNAKQAVGQTQFEKDKESLLSAVIGTINDSAEVDFDKLDKNLPEGFSGSDGTYTSKSGNTFCVDLYGNLIIPQVVIEGKTVELTPYNVGKYLGKVVTNFKKDYNTTTVETIRIDETDYKVSTKYRLYYVDFENKYKDGAGTIYLKAECTDNNYLLQTTAPSQNDEVKIEELNPGLYPSEEHPDIIPPTSTNPNMQAVTWLTNTKNWEGLKNNLNNDIKSEDINYIVGAPSLEMMMDSYNTYYGLTGDTLNTDILTADSPRVKLFYQYPYKGNSNKYGYGVGPSNDSSATDGYYIETSYYTVQSKKVSEDEIGTMYYPAYNQPYWMASPSANAYYGVMSVWSGERWLCY